MRHSPYIESSEKPPLSSDQRPAARGPRKCLALLQPASRYEQRDVGLPQPVRHVGSKVKRLHARCHPSGRSRRQRQNSRNGNARIVMYALPTTWPSRKSRDPNASSRKITLSATKPTTFDATTAPPQCLVRSGVYTPKSINSANRKAAPLATANCGEIKNDRAAPETIAASDHQRPNVSCTRSRQVNAAPAKKTPAGA